MYRRSHRIFSEKLVHVVTEKFVQCDREFHLGSERQLSIGTKLWALSTRPIVSKREIDLEDKSTKRPCICHYTSSLTVKIPCSEMHMSPVSCSSFFGDLNDIMVATTATDSVKAIWYIHDVTIVCQSNASYR